MDNQRSSDEQLSSTQGLIGQKQQLLGQKKKSRGDRKAQRYRRRLRVQGFEEDTIIQMAKNRFHSEKDELTPSAQSNEMVVHTSFDQFSSPRQTNNNNNDNKNTINGTIKRKRSSTTTHKSKTSIHQSMSQLSISQPSPKKHKINDNNDHTISQKNTQILEKHQCLRFEKKSNDDDLPDYLKVSNRIFRQMLISSLEGADKIVKRLNTSEKINFIRQYAYLIHRLFYVQLQEDQWKYYYHIGMTKNIWSGRVSTKWAQMNSMYYTYGRSKKLIEQRLKTISRQLQEASQNLQELSNQALPSYILQMNPTLDFPFLLAIITALVRKGQHKLKQQFESNKKMLIIDSTDHRLIQTVYDLKPTKQQIRAIRNRWKAIYNKKQMEEQIEILKHRIHSNCLPPAFNLLDHSLDKIDEILARTQQSSINVDDNNNNNHQRSTLCARRLKKIGRFKYDMLELSIAAGEEKVRYWNKLMKKETEKLLATKDKLKKHTLFPDIFQQLIVAVEAREEHMIKRADYLKQEKLKSFFDEAPASQNNTTTTTTTTTDDDGVGANQ